MEKVDKELSLIDSVRYTQAQAPADMPAFLDISDGGRVYHYELLIANLCERNQSTRMPTVEHIHPVYHIVLYTSGNGYMQIANRLHPVKQGTLAVIAPGISHAFSPSGGCVSYHALTFALKNGTDSLAWDTDRLLAHYLGKPINLQPLTHPDVSGFALLRRRIESLVSALQNQPIDWLQHQLNMISLLRLIGDLGTATTPLPGLVEQTQVLLDARFADPSLTLQSLAAELHTTPEHLCRQFRRQTGSSPIQYRNRLRIQAARALLRNTNLPCKAIADRLGYSDLYTFSKAYRRAAGHSPVQERNRAE